MSSAAAKGASIVFALFLFHHFSAPFSSADPLTFSGSFTFRLHTHRDNAFTQTLEEMRLRDELQHTRELDAANAGIFSRAIDLLQLVPLKLSDSTGNIDQFFTPNYLLPGYITPPKASLFETND